MKRWLVAAPKFVAPACILTSSLLLILNLGGAAAVVSLYGCGWISYGIVDTLERIADSRRERERKRKLKALLDQSTELRQLFDRGVIK